MSARKSVEKIIYEKLAKKSSFTRTEIYKNCDIRTATVLSVVNELKEKGIITESWNGGRKSGSRASELVLSDKLPCLIGIDFKINYTSGVLIDFKGKVLYSCERDSGCGKNLKEGLLEISDVVNELKGNASERGRMVTGIGFADPGIVDIKRGISLHAVNIDGWKEFHTAEWLKESFDVEDSLVYPAPMALAYREYRNLSKNKNQSLFLLAMGVGIGGAFIKNGELFTGNSNAGMEIGHVVVVPDGPLCKCGNRGCLEAIAGVEGIRKRISEMIREGVNTELSDIDFSIPSFIECVKNNDKAASSLAHEISETIGISVASIAALLNPSVIILSGELAELDEILLTTVKRTVSLRSLPISLKNLEIKISGCSRSATSEGAAILMRNQLLEKLF